MPVYHFTLHAYRSWRPDHPRGYTKRNEGYQPPDPELAQQYDDLAKFPPVEFDQEIQEILILGAHDICTRRGWRLHGIGTDPEHVHIVLSWKTYTPWRQVMEKLKNLLSLFIARAKSVPGRKWFVVNGSRTRVLDDEHLKYLLNTYLPSHRGLCWREGRQLPEDRHGLFGRESD